MTRRQVGTQPKERPCGPLHTAELPVGLVRVLGFRRGWSWGQPRAGRPPLGTARRPSRPHMLLVKGQRSRGGQPTQGTTRGAPSGYIKAEVVRLLLVRKLFRPLSQSRPEVRWCNRVTYFKALFIKEHEAARKPCGKCVAVMDAGVRVRVTWGTWGGWLPDRRTSRCCGESGRVWGRKTGPLLR